MAEGNRLNRMNIKSERTPQKKALETIDVVVNDLKKWNNTPRHFAIAVSKRQTAVRASYIYRAYMKADDKDKEIGIQAEKWAVDENKIRSIIELERRKGVSYTALAAEIEGLRQYKTSQILEFTEEHLAMVNAQIQNLYDRLSSGDKWVEVEETETVGSKNSETKTKKIEIRALVLKLFEKRNEIMRKESETLTPYTGKVEPRLGRGQMRVIVEADAEFMEQFDRMRGFTNEKNTVVDVADDNGNGTG